MAGYIQTESFKVDIQGNRVLSEDDFALIVAPEEGMVVIVDTAGGDIRATAKEMRLYTGAAWKVVSVLINGIMTISAAEGIAAGIILESDQADDAGDSWKIVTSNDDAKATVSVTGGGIQTFTIQDGGAGYLSAPTVVITPHALDSSAASAAATAVLTGDAVTSFTSITAGTGYANIPTISFTGGGKVGKLVISNDQNVKGTFVEHFSLTANATATNSTAAFAGHVTVGGDLTVSGVTTTINSTTLTVDDKNIELGSVDSPTDTTANAGGITLKGATDKTIQWLDTDDRWHFNQGVEIDTGNLIVESGNVGVGVTDPDEKLEVAGRIHISGEVVAPSAPIAADGGILYTKPDGKLYWISDDLSETDLTAAPAVTNLSVTATGGSLTVESSSGTDVALPLADTTNWGVMSDEMFDKLDGIETSADVTNATNVATAGALMTSLADAKGDIFAASADNTVTRLPLGTDTHVLTADSNEASGVKWAAASGGSSNSTNTGQYSIIGGSGNSATLYLRADDANSDNDGDDAADNWAIQAADGNLLTIGSAIADAAPYNTFADILTIQAANPATDSIITAVGNFKADNNFFVEATTNRVGIGVNSPDAKLEIMDSTDDQLKLSYDATNSIELKVSNTGELKATGETSGKIKQEWYVRQDEYEHVDSGWTSIQVDNVGGVEIKNADLGFEIERVSGTGLADFKVALNTPGEVVNSNSAPFNSGNKLHNAVVEIRIFSSGAQDQWEYRTGWKDYSSGVITYTGPSANPYWGTSSTTGPIPLMNTGVVRLTAPSNNILITWQSTTGHTANDEWRIICPTSPADMTLNSSSGKLKISSGATVLGEITAGLWDGAAAKIQGPTGAPAAYNSVGTQGMIRFDSQYIYVCVALNTWKRVSIATWP